MKIQNLAIIFIIIILPISLVIATYTQHQIQTINTQTLYDSKLTSATYDAIRAFQINSTSSATSELTNSKTRDLEASISAFRNSIKSTFSLAGYSEDAIDQYIPALVYTLYDGLYIYSPYENRVNQEGEILDTGDSQYGLKPYISYSCRYVHTIGNIDVVITYALDNHISVRGIVNGEYVNKEGYLVDNIEYDGNKVKYNGIEIEEEQVYQYLPMKEGDNNVYKYIKLNGTTYYADTANERIIARLNDTTLTIQCSKAKNGQEEYEKWLKIIDNNSLAKDYYIDAYNFTKWFKESGLQELTYGDARDSIINDNGETIEDQQLWTNDNQNKKIFKFNTSNSNYNDNIENESSNFNEHRLYIIRHKIEVNMAIAIANYNAYLGVRDTFQMPKIEEGEWYSITHNISLISFLQGLQIGGRQYNGYSLVTNSESKEVVLENNIYILGADGDGNEQYYKIGDKGIRDGVVIISAGEYSNDHTAKSAGRINLDFERGMLVNSDKTKTYYYYPIKNNDASYNSIVMQNEVNTYDDIYKYVNEADYNLKIAFYTALGRERASTYKKWADYVDTNNLKLGYTITYKKSDGGIYDTQNVNAGENHKVKNGITKPGYTFTGWKDTETGRIYAPGEIIQNVNSDMTLKPTFSVSTQKVILDGKEYGHYHSYTVEYNGSVYLQDCDNLKRDGYVFKGWKYGDTYYKGGETIGPVTSDMNLVPEFEKEYTITFNANGAGEWYRYDQVKIKTSGTTKLSLEIDSKFSEQVLGSAVDSSIPFKTNYARIIKGWATTQEKAKNGEADYDIGYNYDKTEDLQLYLVWDRDKDLLEKNKPSIRYKAHLENLDWQSNWSCDGQTAGTTDQGLRLEAIQIGLFGDPFVYNTATVKYQMYVQGLGWQGWRENEAEAGTDHQSRPTYGIQIKLENTDDYSVEYRVYNRTGGWQEWKIDGETAGNIDGSKKIEAIQIRLVVKDEVNYSQFGRIGKPLNNTVMAIGANPSGNSAQFNCANMDVYSIKIDNHTGCVANFDATNNTGAGHNNYVTTWKNLVGNNNGTINGGTWGNDYLRLNGTNNWVNLGQINLETTVKFEATISINEIQSGEVDIVSNFELGGAGIFLINGYPTFDLYSSKKEGYIRLQSTTRLNVKTKTTIEGIYDGKNMYLKVDGKIVGQN